MINPDSVFIKVVFPALLDPISPTISPSFTAMLRPFKASAFSKNTIRLLTSNMIYPKPAQPEFFIFNS